jgi:Flp pilus assembly protein TadB
VLSDWRRIPFTCSYLPGKRFVFYSLTVGVLAWALFAVVGAALVSTAHTSLSRAALIVVILLVLAWVLRRRRSAMWDRSPLMFEDEFPDQPLQLQL